MPNDNYNKNHAASIEYVNDAIVESWEKFKTWLTTNVDQLDYVSRVITKLRTAYRSNAYSTAIEYAQAIETSAAGMVQSFTSAGLDLTGLTMADFATCIDQLATNAGVYINDSDGLKWTWQRWASEKQRLQHDPAQREGIMLHNPDHNFLVASVNQNASQWGTYSHTVPSLEVMSGGNAGTPKDGNNNCYRILAATDPDKLTALGKAATYSQSLTRWTLAGKYVAFFPNESTLISWANTQGLTDMLAIGTDMIYAIPHATETGKYILKYFNGTQNISFANREAIAPYADNYGQIGCAALAKCMLHQEHEDDTNFWRLPTAYEALMIYLNKEEINNCRTALGESALPTSTIWLCLQYSSSSASYLSLVDGSSSYSNKSNAYQVLAVASN